MRSAVAALAVLGILTAFAGMSLYAGYVVRRTVSPCRPHEGLVVEVAVAR
jgi:hypothetical protein